MQQQIIIIIMKLYIPPIRYPIHIRNDTRYEYVNSSTIFYIKDILKIRLILYDLNNKTK
jgi:hypothetical protein